MLKFYDKGTITQFEGRGLTVDIQSREVLVDGQIVNLSPKEYNVLEYLCRHRGQACSKDEIAVVGWPEYNGGIGSEAPVGDQDLEQLIRRLRRRIEKDPGNPRYIITMKGYGYRLSAF